MSETTHTPGPWRLHLTDETMIVGLYGGIVATTYQADYGINCERRAADAHLIAAAPDLYEALYDLVAVCEKQPRISKSFPDPGSPLGKARSALAKARGEA